MSLSSTWITSLAPHRLRRSFAASNFKKKEEGNEATTTWRKKKTRKKMSYGATAEMREKMMNAFLKKKKKMINKNLVRRRFRRWRNRFSLQWKMFPISCRRWCAERHFRPFRCRWQLKLLFQEPSKRISPLNPFHRVPLAIFYRTELLQRVRGSKCWWGERPLPMADKCKCHQHRTLKSTGRHWLRRLIALQDCRYLLYWWHRRDLRRPLEVVKRRRWCW